MENQIKLRKYRRFKYICLLERNEATKAKYIPTQTILRNGCYALDFLVI